MSDARRVVDFPRDASEVRCRYCSRTFKSPRGRSIHERACKKKDSQKDLGEEHLLEAKHSLTNDGKKLAKDSSGMHIKHPRGELRVDPRMPDAGYISGASLEIRNLIAQMEKERKRWERERKKFLEQTEGLAVGKEKYLPEGIPDAVSEVGLRMGDAEDSEARILAQLERIRKELSHKADIESVSRFLEWREELKKQINDLDENIATLTTVLGEFSARTLEDLASLRKGLEAKADEGELVSMMKTMKKIDNRLEDVVEEVGFGEHLDVSKVPPKILELSYQTTLDDITGALDRMLGTSEAERIVTGVMEEIRQKTSGSELFRFQSPRFRIQGLASSIERGLVSAKQVQMTYEELLKKLTEHIPEHNLKNFRALIKVKSQEFATETSTRLMKDLEKMRDEIESVRESVSKISESISQEMSRISSELEKMSKKLEIESPGRESVSPKSPSTRTFNQSLGRERGRTAARPKEEKDGFEGDHLGNSEKKEGTPTISQEEKLVLSAIPADGVSFTVLRRKLEPSLSSKNVQHLLDSLISMGLIRKKRRGKGFVYFHEKEEP